MGISHNIDKVAWSSSQLLVLMSCGYFKIDKTMGRCCQIIFLPISSWLIPGLGVATLNETKCRTVRRFDSSLAEQSELLDDSQHLKKNPLICFYQGVGTLSFLKPTMLSCMYNFLLVFLILLGWQERLNALTVESSISLNIYHERSPKRLFLW